MERGGLTTEEAAAIRTELRGQLGQGPALWKRGGMDTFKLRLGEGSRGLPMGQTQKCRAGEILRPPPDVPPPSGSVGNGKRILLAGVQVGAAPSTLSECPERTRPTRPSLRGREPPRPLRELLCTPEARDAYGNPERAHLLCPAKVWGPFHRDATPAPRWAGSVSPSCPGSPFQSSWHCWQLTLRRNTDFKALEANSSTKPFGT